jgi:hypothetical protein
LRVYANWQEVPGGKELPDTPEKSEWWALVNRLKIWRTGKMGGWQAMAACYPQIVFCLLNPLIFWVALLNALIFGSQVSIFTTYADLLNDAPYNLPTGTINLMSQRQKC